MKILTASNDTRNLSTESLVNEWAEKLHDATIIKKDWSLRNHLKRAMPQGLRSQILTKEASLSIK